MPTNSAVPLSTHFFLCFGEIVVLNLQSLLLSSPVSAAALLQWRRKKNPLKLLSFKFGCVFALPLDLNA